jgi:hypothetical protein
MGDILRAPNNNAILLIPRSASHSLALASLQSFWPEKFLQYENLECSLTHPASFFPNYESFNNQFDLAIIVRNPVERFRSMCAHRPNRTLEEHLEKPHYDILPTGNFIRYFKFETQLDECADWLVLPIPLIHEDKSDPTKKPNLIPEQESIVRSIYAKDIELWESLNA